MDEEAPSETEARQRGLSYIKLDGEIGCMVNGAGLAMATMDMTKLFGGSPANFLDIGGGAQADKVAAALRIILADPNVKAVLFNIFGGITRCDEVARGIVAALEEVKPNVPMVARLVGTNEEEGRRILAAANMQTATHAGRSRAKGRGAGEGRSGRGATAAGRDQAVEGQARGGQEEIRREETVPRKRPLKKSAAKKPAAKKAAKR